MSNPATFWNRIARKYAAQPITDTASYEHKLALTRQYFTAASRVLEYGCGTGATAISHAPYVAEILATDVSDAMIDIARERGEAAGVSNVRFAVLDIEREPVPDGPYDVVLALNVLHLVVDRRGVIAKTASALKDDGVFITSTACLGDAMGFLRWIKPVAHWLGLWPYFAIFTQAQLETDMREAGLTIEQVWRPSKTAAVFMVARKAQ